MKAILIAEKPSLMREIQAAYREHRSEIPFEIDFLSQAGHLVGLKMPEEIDEEKYKKWRLDNFPIDVPYQYKILPGKGDLVKNIRTAVRNGEYDFVIHAGDPDGEGELLIRLVLDYVGNALPVKRFWINDQTHAAIVRALNHMRNDSEYDAVYHAALVRQHEDYQFGMNATGTATLKLGELYKLGRVKAAIIRMIVDRELAIRNFVQSSTWKRCFTYDGCEFVNGEEFEEETRAKASLPAFPYATVTEVKDEVKSHKAPKLYKLSTLQTDAHKKLHFSGAQTLALLQNLYEAKVVSYPRTDCEYISSGVDIGSIKNNICNAVGVDTKLLVRSADSVKGDSQYVNDKAIASEGHTAIIPTGAGSFASLGENEKKLYDLIARRFLAIFGNVKQVRNLSVTAIPGEDAILGNYVWKESMDVAAGYELVLDPSYQCKIGKNRSFQKGQVLKPVEFTTKECVAKPPARYNDGSLIAAMDKPEAFQDGEKKVAYKIGTPATRANIIKECIACGYIQADKNGVYASTQKAERVIEELGDIALFNVTNSGRWEAMLEQIRHGEADAKEVETLLQKECINITEDIKSRDIKKAAYSRGEGSASVLGTCPKCGGNIVSGKFGAYCTNKCGMQVSKAMGKVLTDAQVRSLLEGKKVLIRGIKSSKPGKSPYDAYLKVTGTEDFTYQKNGTGEPITMTGLKFEISFPPRK
jgi:DNA topoisomerase-3